MSGKGVVLTVVLVLLGLGVAAAQTGTITGKVTDADGNPMPGANLSIEGTSFGAASGPDGTYTIAGVPAGTYTLVVRFIGFQGKRSQVTVLAGQTVTQDFKLLRQALFGETLVVSATRRPQKLTEAPASISVVTAKELARSTGFTYGEGLQKAKGVDVYRTGIDGVGINARGFMTAYSYRMQLMSDGKNSMLPGAGLAAGQLLPVARDDIERVETILGPSSALYGPNAHNGLVNIITKDPRDSQGTTLALGGGNREQLIGRFRHAQSIGERFAFKVNAEYLRARDFMKNDTTGMVTNPVTGETRVFMENPDPDISNFRFDGSLYYSLTNNMDAIFSAGYGNTNSIGTTNVGRNQIVDWVYEFYQLRIESKHFFVQGYLTKNDAGDTYAIENATTLEQLSFAAGQPITREQAIQAVKFIDKSRRYNIEAQANTQWHGFNFIGGMTFEDSRPVSEGTYLTDTTGQKIELKQTGIYGQIERDLGERFRFVAAARYDGHSSYASQFSPRAAVLYRVPGKGAFRFTYNRAFQAPAILQQELLLQFGAVSGTTLPIMLRGNGRGLTLADGTQIKPLEVEENQTFEVGYKGLVADKLFVDLNAYHSRYENFISPLTLVGNLAAGNPVVKQGDGLVTSPEVTFTYRNFGRVNVVGLDVGATLQINRHWSVWGNFSWIDPRDIDDPENDFDGDGKFEELSFNTPEKKYNLGIAATDLITRGTYFSLSMRHVDEYDFISGRHRATRAGEGTGAFQFKDRGPLGGFETFDFYASYQMDNGIMVNLGITNLFDTAMREMVGSPPIGRLANLEVKYNFNLFRRR